MSELRRTKLGGLSCFFKRLARSVTYVNDLHLTVRQANRENTLRMLGSSGLQWQG